MFSIDNLKERTKSSIWNDLFNQEVSVCMKKEVSSQLCI